MDSGVLDEKYFVSLYDNWLKKINKKTRRRVAASSLWEANVKLKFKYLPRTRKTKHLPSRLKRLFTNLISYVKQTSPDKKIFPTSILLPILKI